MSPKKFLIVIILIIGAALGGYYYGFYKSSPSQKQLLALQQKLEQAEFRLKILVDVKQKLEKAQGEIAQKNFGLAQKQVEEVQNIFKELEAKAEPGVKKKLEELHPAIQEILKGLSALDFAMVSKIEELKTALEKIALG